MKATPELSAVIADRASADLDGNLVEVFVALLGAMILVAGVSPHGDEMFASGVESLARARATVADHRALASGDKAVR